MKKYNLILNICLLASGLLCSCQGLPPKPTTSNDGFEDVSYRNLTKDEALKIVHDTYEHAKDYKLRKGEIQYRYDLNSSGVRYVMNGNTIFDIENMMYDNAYLGHCYRLLDDKLYVFDMPSQEGDIGNFTGSYVHGGEYGKKYIWADANGQYTDLLTWTHILMLRLLYNSDDEIGKAFNYIYGLSENEVKYTSFNIINKTIKGTDNDLDMSVTISYKGEGYNNATITRNLQITDNLFTLNDYTLDLDGQIETRSTRFIDHIVSDFCKVDLESVKTFN